MKQWELYADLYNEVKGPVGDEFYNNLIQPILNNFFGDYSGVTVLDAGCGNGFLSNKLSQTAKKVVGIDSSIRLLQHAKKNCQRSNVSFEKADLTKKLSFPDKQFDFVIAVMVLQFLPTIKNFVSECSRIINNKGKLIIIIDHPAQTLFLRAQELVGKKDRKFIDSGSYFSSGKRKKRSLRNKATLQYYL